MGNILSRRKRTLTLSKKNKLKKRNESNYYGSKYDSNKRRY